MTKDNSTVYLYWFYLRIKINIPKIIQQRIRGPAELNVKTPLIPYSTHRKRVNEIQS